MLDKIGIVSGGAGLMKYFVMPLNGWYNPPLQHQKLYTTIATGHDIIPLAATQNCRDTASVIFGVLLKVFRMPCPGFGISNYQLPITNYQLPITNYQLPITVEVHESPEVDGGGRKVLKAD